MTTSRDPSWFYPGDLARSVEATMETDDATIDHLIDVLQAHEFDAPRERLRAVILSVKDRLEARGEEDVSQTTDDPRSLPARFVSVEDVPYLGREAFGRILGITLSSYDGTYQALGYEDDRVVDLLWSRQHRTIGLRTECRPQGTPVDDAVITDIIKGKTTPATGRSPSVLGVITNTSFTADARTLATDNNIELFGREWLDQRFKEIQLSWEMAGPVIEATENDEEAVEELIDEQDLLPATFNDIDPFTDDPTSNEISIGTGGRNPSSSPGTPPVPEDDPAPRQRSVLYADPSDDGDFDAFDRFAESLGGDE